jgi:hypothetical protein
VARNATAGHFRWPMAVDRDRSDARSRQVEPEPGPSLLLFDEEEHNLRSAYGPGGLASAMDRTRQGGETRRLGGHGS